MWPPDCFLSLHHPSLHFLAPASANDFAKSKVNDISVSVQSILLTIFNRAMMFCDPGNNKYHFNELVQLIKLRFIFAKWISINYKKIHEWHRNIIRKIPISSSSINDMVIKLRLNIITTILGYVQCTIKL